MRTIPRATWLVEPGRWVALALLAVGPSPLTAQPMDEDPRSRAVLEYDCRTDLSRRAVTLFANGTIRLRTEGLGARQVRLSELGPEELAGLLRRLSGEDLSETDQATRSPEGEWVEKCLLELKLPGKEARNFVIDRYGSPSLALSRVLTVANELGEKVERESVAERHLPNDYQPAVGDIVERHDGGLFRINEFSVDKRSVELVSADGLIVLYLTREDFRREFVSVLERRSRIR